MRHSRRVIPLCLLAALAGAPVVSASGFELVQHGGRAIGQVGTFTARAPEPSAVTFNPAAITQLDGFQLQAGLDLSFDQATYSSATGHFSNKHIIQFPPTLYATWKQKQGPFALGLGIDSPFYKSLEWQQRLFPGRFLARRVELRVFEIHPVLAYDLGGGWSVGGGVRYAFGNLDQDANAVLPISIGAATPVDVEVERNAGADVDALAWDLAVHYASSFWGWGAVYRSAERLEGSGNVSYDPRDVPVGVPGLDAALQARFGPGRARQAFEIPQEARAGVWYAPYPELRFELDTAYQTWSSLEATSVTYDPDAFGDGPTVRTVRHWKDTTGLRLGVEGDLTDNVSLFGGIAQEPSPVPAATLEPGFPYGDATVYGGGFTVNLPQISFDVGYSLHEYASRGAVGQEPEHPGRAGSYGGRDQVWGFSVRWRLSPPQPPPP